MDKKQAAILLFVIAFGYSFHIILDLFVLGGPYMPLYPFSNFTMPRTFVTQDQMFGLDAILLLVWLAHEEYKHRIKDYI
jgi:membrane-bound metal-dependent hydrolase YbcI (DUF457 family)